MNILSTAPVIKISWFWIVVYDFDIKTLLEFRCINNIAHAYSSNSVSAIKNQATLIILLFSVAANRQKVQEGLSIVLGVQAIVLDFGVAMGNKPMKLRGGAETEVGRFHT